MSRTRRGFNGARAKTNPVLSPALAAQHDDDQAVSSDAQDEDEGVDHGREDLLEVSGHHVLHITGLLEIHPQVTRTRTRAGVIVVVEENMLQTDDS